MKLFIIAILVLLLASCVAKPIETTTTENNVKVELLFTVKGCEVYRFKDGAHYIYFVINPSGTSHKTTLPYTASTGKNSSETRYREVLNVKDLEEGGVK